jgi:hypothetical protein
MNKNRDEIISEATRKAIGFLYKIIRKEIFG